MSYTKEEIKVIERRFPSLRKLPTPSLDNLIIAFLKKYDVDVQPLTSKKAQQAKENWVDTSITLMAGPSLGYEATEVTKLKQQTKIQEWTQWKQWALDHNDFPAFKETALEKIKKHNEDREKRLSSDTELRKKIEPWVQKYKKQEMITLSIFTIVFGFICFWFVLAATSDSKENNDISRLQKQLIITSAKV